MAHPPGVSERNDCHYWAWATRNSSWVALPADGGTWTFCCCARGQLAWLCLFILLIIGVPWHQRHKGIWWRRPWLLILGSFHRKLWRSWGSLRSWSFFFHPPAEVMTQAHGVERRAPWGLRWGTLQIRATLGHKQGLMEALCPICFPRTVLLGCERQHDKVGGFKVAFCGLGCKDAVAAPEDSIF